MAAAEIIALRVDCPTCDRPFTVRLPLHTEPVDGWHRVVVDTDQLTLAVRAHTRQHEVA